MKKTMHSPHLPAVALRMRRRAGARAQAGLSLLELMVGMAIGMLVVLAALGTIMFTRTSASTMSASSRLEQQANLTMMLLGRQIMQAAAMNMQVLPLAAANPASAASAAAGAGAQELKFYTDRPGTGFTDTDREKFDKFAYSGLDGKPGGSGTRPLYVQGADAATATQGDTLTISYPQLDAAGAAGEGNCINDPAVGFPATVTGSGVRTRQFVSSVTTSGDISQPQGGSLVCGTPAAVDADSGAAKAATSQPIASGVRDFQVRYLQSTTTNAVSSNAADLATRDAWAGVRGVEICLHMVSANVSAAAATPVLGCRGEAIANDARIHKVVRQVFYLRNSGSV